MPQVDFYILPEQATVERFTCEIADQIHGQGLDVYVLAGSRNAALALDDLMWTWKDTSFLPHRLVDSDDDDCRITIGWEGAGNRAGQVLINLVTTVPQDAGNFERVVEFVPPGATEKQLARQRYRHYREAGFELRNHDLNSPDELS